MLSATLIAGVPAIRAFELVASPMTVSFSRILVLSTARLLTLIAYVTAKVLSAPTLLTAVPQRTALEILASLMVISFS